MNRRRSAVCAIACTLLTLSSCSTFNRNDVAARVGDHTLSVKVAHKQLGQPPTAQQQHGRSRCAPKIDARGSRLRRARPARQAQAQYEQGIAGSPAICLAAIPRRHASMPPAPIMAALQSGMSFADAARQFSDRRRLWRTPAASCWRQTASECMPPATLAPAVADGAEDDAGRPADRRRSRHVLGGAVAAPVRRATAGVAGRRRHHRRHRRISCRPAVANADIYVDPRYGRWDSASSGRSSPLSS